MKAYLDTSVIVPLFAPDALVDRADRLLGSDTWQLIVSDLARAEFFATLGRRIRIREMDRERAGEIAAAFDAWASRFARAARIEPADFAFAETYLRRFDLSLRTPDALHIAASRRLDATLLSFDRALLDDAGRLSLPVRTLA